MIKTTLTTLALATSMWANAQYQNNTVTVNSIAPELSFKTPEGNLLSLKDVNKNKYILVDFWASWCGPCRKANPGLVKFYNEYSKKRFVGAKKGFDILSVSLDKDATAWKNAISKDSLYWKNHMSDLKGWQSDAATLYGVQYIPQAFLLDPQGKVIGTYMLAEQAIPDIEKLVDSRRKKFLGIF